MDELGKKNFRIVVFLQMLSVNYHIIINTKK